MKKDPKLHLGHFARVRTQVMQTDVHHLSQELVFEMLLQIPMHRGDANEIARRLVAIYGDFNKFCRLATYEKLLQVDGIGEIVAQKLVCLCKLFMYAKYHLGDDVKGKTASLRSIVQTLDSIYEEAETEMIVLFILNKKNEILHHTVLNHGSINSVALNLDQIADLLRIHRGQKLIISHNHPDGPFFPSIEDLDTTGRLYSFCMRKGVELVDHIIMNKTGYFSFRYSRVLAAIERGLLEKIEGRRLFPD